jgi:alginate O-acetyltransferase complex protein AlgI
MATLNGFFAGSLFDGARFFLKMVVADNLAYYLNHYWNDGTLVGGTAPTALLLAFLFSCQIFTDFEGYTGIARGAAYLLGFRLPVNFNNPYLAASFKEFWSRWHITLSHWMRDYLYIPLGGNQVPEGRLYFNLFLVMVLAGLWHGAAYTFIVWGALHGAALVLEKILKVNRLSNRFPWVRILWFFVVQGVVLVAWVFFRARDLEQAMTLMGDLFLGPWAGGVAASLIPGLSFTLPVVLFHAWGYLREKNFAPELGFFMKGAWCAVMLYLILSFYGENNAFIYYQF